MGAPNPVNHTHEIDLTSVLADVTGEVLAFLNSTVFFPVQATTVGAPAYVRGGVYFDTTLNKLRIGGASGWETVTSA